MAASGFSYDPESFMVAGIGVYNLSWRDMGVPSLHRILEVVQVGLLWEMGSVAGFNPGDSGDALVISGHWALVEPRAAPTVVATWTAGRCKIHAAGGSMHLGSC